MISVVCAVIFIGDKVLVTQRSALMKLPLKWEFPGGKIELNESEIECVKREIREEINIEIEVRAKLTESIYDYGMFKIKLIPFIATPLSGEINLTEHLTYKLLKSHELLELDWAEADLPIVHEIITLNL